MLSAELFSHHSPRESGRVFRRVERPARPAAKRRSLRGLSKTGAKTGSASRREKEKKKKKKRTFPAILLLEHPRRELSEERDERARGCGDGFVPGALVLRQVL
jgi:hypothetical protein